MVAGNAAQEHTRSSAMIEKTVLMIRSLEDSLAHVRGASVHTSAPDSRRAALNLGSASPVSTS